MWGSLLPRRHIIPRSQSSIHVPQVRSCITPSAPASTVALLSLSLSLSLSLYILISSPTFSLFSVSSSQGALSHFVTVAGSSGTLFSLSLRVKTTLLCKVSKFKAFLGFHLPEKKWVFFIFAFNQVSNFF